MNRKFKLLVLFTSVIIVLFIYKATYHKSYNYIALGDGVTGGVNSYGVEDYSYSDYLKDELNNNKRLIFYTKDFSVKGYSINDLYEDITNNKVINIDGKKTSIRKALRESNLVTISIGSNDFLKLFSYSIDDNVIEKIKSDKTYYFKRIDKIISDYDKLVREIKKYAKGRIILIGYYNPKIGGNIFDEIVRYSNYMVELMADDNNIDFIDISDEINNKNYFSNPSDMHLNKEGYKKISGAIMGKLNF